MPAHVMNYIERDAPADLTLAEWRRSRLTAPPRRCLGWIRTRPRPAAAPAPAA